MTKAKLEMRSKDDNQALAAGNVVEDSMTTNAAEFPGSAATVTSLGTKITAFAAALSAFQNGRVAQQALTDAKAAARVEMETVLMTLMGQVDTVAQGDLNLIHDAGMQGTDEPSPVSMTQVLNLRLTPSENDAEVLAKWGPVTRAKVYQVQVCTDATTPPLNWVEKVISPKAKCSLNHDLVSGTKVWARVRAIGANDVGAWSDPAWKTVP